MFVMEGARKKPKRVVLTIRAKGLECVASRTGQDIK
jgi:hypothetical protein